ncbi:MAG: HU family DNA-binding protein [Tannerellaceae bacterium]|jgi:predicted histone-like DNA-binding protein|nr:HU family DNA-binding protein [Tannerellaceae bacterium]
MGYKYDFYRSPVPKGSGRQETYHARVVPSGTIEVRELAELIQSASSATVGDVMLVVEQLVEQIIFQLSRGMRVSISGLGVFELTLENRPVTSPKEIRSESIRVRSVVLRPDKDMKRALSKFTAVRSEVKNHSRSVTDAEVEGILRRYFEEHDFLTSKEFRGLCGFTESTASRRLRRLRAEEKLKATGHLRSPLYLKGDKL